MFGLGDFGISLVYVLCILSAVLCICYGIINWNKGAETEEKVDMEWKKDEAKLEDEIG